MMYQNMSFEVKRPGKEDLLAERAWWVQNSGERANRKPVSWCIWKTVSWMFIL